MKTLLSFKRQFCFCFVLVLIAASCTQAPSELDVKADIERINETMTTAISNQDVETLMAHYTDDVLMLPSNHDPVEGIEAVRQMWTDGFKHGMGHLEFITGDATAVGDIAQEHGVYKYYTPDKQMVDHGKYMVLWKKVGDQWKIAKDIWNSSLPMPPRAGAKDTIALAITKVKPENIEPLKKFGSEVFLPAFEKHFADAKATARLFEVVNNEKGEGELIYFIDPYKSYHTHDVKAILTKHYAQDEVEKYMKEFKSYIIKQEMLMAVPVGW